MRFRRDEFGLRLDPDRWRLADFTNARDAFARFERFQFQFVEINDFAALTKAALHQEPGERLFGFVRRGKFDVPEIRARLKNMDSVEKAFGFVIDFRDDSSARGPDTVSFQRPL